VFDYVLKRISGRGSERTSPSIVLLETPAGFELNSDRVIGRVAEFLEERLQNYHARVTVVPARKRDTAYSPNDPAIVAPILEADVIFMGPGSPSYAVRQLSDSLAWQYLVARHRLGAAVVLASAAAIAVSLFSLPVYEIYKVGEDLHWKNGLDLFGLYGLPLVFIPHWNNHDGGEELDTSRCFMGQMRFARLVDLLPTKMTLLGIDEKTALVMEPSDCTCRVLGQGGVTVIHMGHDHPLGAAATGEGLVDMHELARRREGHVHYYTSGVSFPLSDIGPFCQPPPDVGLPGEVWERALEALEKTSSEGKVESERQDTPPEEVLALVEQRQAARLRKDWKAADVLRDKLAGLGWQLMDTPEGTKAVKTAKSS
jgi:cyanophycinase-like exopeptidase